MRLLNGNVAPVDGGHRRDGGFGRVGGIAKNTL